MGEEKTDQEIAREEKFRKLIELGVSPFPDKYSKTHSVSDVVEEFSSYSRQDLDKEKFKVSVPGRIISLRKMGRASFFHISDGLNKIQGYIKQDKVGEKEYQIFNLLDIGDFIGIEGILFRTKTEELTIFIESLTFLAKSFRPLPEKWHGLQDIEIRYRQRYLDLIINPEVRKVFRLRSTMIKEIRRFFDERGFLEVETPMMHPIPGGALARPFKTFHNALGIDLYLRIAPELYLKRLIVGGYEKVYEINRNFRNEGISSQHNPEFTMLEFYQAYSNYHDLIELTEELLSHLCTVLIGAQEVKFKEEIISFKPPYQKIKFKEALIYHSGISPAKFENKTEIIRMAQALDPEKKTLSYGKALDILFDKQVRQKLIQPTFILNHLKEVSPLAKASPDNPEEAERFELIIGGMEIANAFSELTDPKEQRERFEQQVTEREEGVEEAHLIDDDYITTLQYGLPPTAGEGIGIDRLAMILANKQSIREVILFPLLKPKI
ncbi:MAG: lysine--tRNA ligase [Candidatus Aminicenantia bacterium]